jgi:polyphosphate kinase
MFDQAKNLYQLQKQAKEIKKDLIEALKMYFKDNVKSWKLAPDGSYQKIDSKFWVT